MSLERHGKFLIAAIVAAAAPLATLLWLSGSVNVFAALGAMLVFAAVTFVAGELLLRLADARDLPLAAAWVLGIFASALAVYALVAWLHLLAATAFAVWTAAVLALALASSKRPGPPRKVDPREWVGLALCAAATLTWCWEVAEVPRILAREERLTAWIDYYIHGGVISHFGDPRGGRESIYLADFPASFYHYASYLLPAAFAWPLDLPGFPLATSVWLPLGFFTLCAGAYALGAALAGPAGGIAAVAALAALPDASNYGLRNGFFSFHWHLLAFPGAPYAVGIFLVAIVLLQRWLASGNPRPLLAAAVLGAGSVLFRVHVFALGFPAVAASAALLARLAPRRRIALLAGSLAAFAVFVWAFYAFTASSHALGDFLTSVHEHQLPTAYAGWYASLLKAHGSAMATPAGVALALAACLGLLVLLYPASLLVAWRSGGLQAIDVVPVVFIAGYIVLMLTAPTIKWDATELTVRPFVLLYAVVAVWTFAAFAKWFSSGGERRSRIAWRALVAASALALVALWPQTGKLGILPKFYWGWAHYPSRVKPGVVQAGDFLRRSSRAGDVFAVQDVSLEWVASDLAIQIAALTGMPAYLGYGIAQLDGGERERVARQRHAALREVAAAATPEDALRRLRELRVQWYVVGAEPGPRWDPERRQAAFAAGAITVYSTGGR